MVPKGWDIVSFGSLAEFRNGLNYSKSDSGESIKIIGVADFKDNFELGSFESLETISVANKVKNTDLIQSGDLLFVRSNGNKALIGRCLFFPSVTEKLSFSGFTIRGRVVADSALPNYLAVLSRSSLVKQQFSKSGGGTNISNLSQQILSDIVVPLPPLPEQRKIAQILSTWDRAITATEKLVETSKQQKKALMQQLLTGKKRLLNPETGKAFEGAWDTVQLSELFSRLTEKNNGQSTNVVTISAQHGLIRQEEFFKKSVASETLDNYFILRKGQFAYNKSYSNGYPMGAIKRLNRYEDGVVTSLYICFEIKDEQATSSCFMEQYFESGLLNKGLTQVAAEGGRAHGLLNVKPSDFMALAMKVPAVSEQNQIAKVLTAADKEVATIERKLNQLKEEKKALMQQLLTGKRRVITELQEGDITEWK
ncbi:restriction endonuclease subunit S [Shewanella sp. 3B26]|uniref:Restriction endonuclease subunit S n=1 Tax=Shewanella zhuhaiensis TaxID=2919576 RepID=A0AAJ1BJP3_9GAMM|nr:restriction endonuclease subunit S [Shewanella zhuhaiensis]MCH4296126.1 restriction endonuclease subunit S [Shewanella zhuhaiensis]